MAVSWPRVWCEGEAKRVSADSFILSVLPWLNARLRAIHAPAPCPCCCYPYLCIYLAGYLLTPTHSMRPCLLASRLQRQ